MAEIWTESELTLHALDGKRIAIIGYGAQGQAQALNLKDAGVEVVIGLRTNSVNVQIAQKDRLKVHSMEEAIASADVIVLLTPDTTHQQIVDDVINREAQENVAIVFAHGYNITFDKCSPRKDLQILLVAPKAIGPELRRLYLEDKGVALLVAAHRGDLEIAKSYAKAIGGRNSFIIHSSFREETISDLFSEQAVLIGGVPQLVKTTFDVLIESGYSPEIAYFECVFELLLITRMMVQSGPAGMLSKISDTAKFGGMRASKKIVDDDVRSSLKKLLLEIQSGEFTIKLEDEKNNNFNNVKNWIDSWDQSLLQKTFENIERLKKQR